MVRGSGDLRAAAAAASEAVEADQARLQDAVQAARERGRSWNQLAIALGVSRRAARQRFADGADSGSGSGPLAQRTVGGPVGTGASEGSQVVR